MYRKVYIRTYISSYMGSYTSNNLMAGIKTYTKREFDGLSQEQKVRHYETIIRKILENSEEGITISKIQELIPYSNSDKTIQRYLDKFINTNFAYKKLIGRTYLYFHNGRLLHEALKENIAIGKKIYSFYHIKNPEGEFIFIQEKNKNELNALTISGGIIIETKNFEEFVQHLQEINKKVNKYH